MLVKHTIGINSIFYFIPLLFSPTGFSNYAAAHVRLMNESTIMNTIITSLIYLRYAYALQMISFVLPIGGMHATTA